MDGFGSAAGGQQPHHPHRRACLRLMAGALLATCVLGACARQAPAAPNPAAPAIRLAADGASFPLAEDLLNGYESLNPHILITLTHGSRPSALAALEAGEVDGVLLLYPLEDGDLFHTPVAREMIVMIAHPDVPVGGLTRRDVRALFSGQIVAWPAPTGEVGLPVQVVAREGGNSTRLAFEALVMGGQPHAASARLASDERHMLQLVGEMPGAVGYTTRSALSEGVKVLDYEASAPTPQNARTNAYPLVTLVEFVASGEPEGALRDFLDWALSDEGQAIARRHMLGLSD